MMLRIWSWRYHLYQDIQKSVTLSRTGWQIAMSGLQSNVAFRLEKMEIFGCCRDAEVQEGVFIMVTLQNIRAMEKEGEFHKNDQES